MSSTDFKRIQKRVNDCVAQTRCDKRTLATLLQFHLKGRGHVSSLSELVRLTLEMVEKYVENNESDLLVLSTEDADDMLTNAFKANLHPGGRYMTTFVKQLSKEDMYLEDIHLPENKVTKKIIDQRSRKLKRELSAIAPAELRKRAQEIINEEKAKSHRTFRTPDNIETIEEAVLRREQEALGTDLSAVPKDTVATEED
jgi:hypothetical protein